MLRALHRLWSEDAPGWELVVVHKTEAEHLLTASRELKQDLEGSAGRWFRNRLAALAGLSLTLFPPQLITTVRW